MTRSTLSLALLLLLLLPTHVKTQSAADAGLLAEVNGIKAVDNHAHALSAAGPDGREDEEYDAIPCGKLEFVAPPPVRLRPDNPIYTGAWRALYGYAHGESMAERDVRELLEAKRRVMRERGEGYPAWVLDRLNIDVMLANRVAPGRGLAAPRFRWVAYGDPLMLPLGTDALRVNPDRRVFYEREEMLLRRDLAALKLSGLPATLDLYLKTVVTPALERRRREGARRSWRRWFCARTRPGSTSCHPEAARTFKEGLNGAKERAVDVEVFGATVRGRVRGGLG